MEIVRTDAENALLAFSERPLLEGPTWFQELQARAREDFLELGLPNRRVEAWKYTDLKSIMRTAFPAAKDASSVSKEALEAGLGAALSGLDAYRLVLVDGRFDESLSDDIAVGGVEFCSLKAAFGNAPSWLEDLGGLKGGERDAVQALNLALVQDGIAVHIEEKCKLDKPLHVVFLSRGEAEASYASRVFFKVGAAAEVSVVESHINLGGTGAQSNIVTEWQVGDWAKVRHLKHSQLPDETVHLANIIGQLGKEVDFGFFQLTVDGGVSRNQIFMRYEGAGSKADISGAALLNGTSHADMTLVMEHDATDCESRELFKTVLNGRSRAVFQGKVIVAPGAQKTDGEMMSKALLLSEDAEFDSKPELEIYADDVLCGHGATTGQIDEDLLFYLKARGIPDAAARQMLIQAFVGEALELVEDEALQAHFTELAAEWYLKENA